MRAVSGYEVERVLSRRGAQDVKDQEIDRRRDDGALLKKEKLALNDDGKPQTLELIKEGQESSASERR